MGMEMNPQEASRTPLSLLELAASDDLDAFRSAVEQARAPLDEPGVWYTRRIGTPPSYGCEQRTPLMVAAQYGSLAVVDYILASSSPAAVNRAAGSDRATALHCAVAGGSPSTPAVVSRLVAASADVDALSSSGHRASDLIPRLGRQQQLEPLLLVGDLTNSSSSNEERPGPGSQPGSPERRGVELPDINSGVYGTDEFRMYCFKIKPCSRAYTHDWTECPYAHPGENARRRDPSKHQYTCVPCPDFKKGCCKKGDACDFAHGVFESWLHPAQYRTRLCKDEIGCSRKVCFFAHRREELRPVYASTGSAIPGPDMPLPSPPGSPVSAWQHPPGLQLPGSRLRTSLSARDVEIDYLSPGRLEPAFSPVRKVVSPPRMGESPKSVISARAAAFASRSQSFVDRRAAGPMNPNGPGNWGSPDGKLDWGMGVAGEELNKLRKSNSFGFRGNVNDYNITTTRGARGGSPPGFNEPDVSWVNSLVKDDVSVGFPADRRGSYGSGGAGGGDMWSPWVEQLYKEQEQWVA